MRYEDERPVPPRRARVLVAAAPGDPRAIRLVDDLQAMGWDVQLAETPDVAEDYAGESICVAVLRPRYWNAPPIAAMVRANPPYLIPVLAEQMPLPRGPWAYEPIPMESPSQVAEEVAQAIEDGVRALGMRRPSYPPRNAYPPAQVDEFAGMATARGTAQSAAGIGARSLPGHGAVRVSAPPATPAKKGGSRVAGTIISLIVAAGLIFGGIKYGYPYIKKYLHKSTTASTTSAPVAYATTLPGPNCDTGGGVWEHLGDASLAGTCEKNGFLLKKNSNFGIAGEVFFDGKGGAPFPASYQVQITATIESGDANAAVGLEVHRQTTRGGEILAAANAVWEFDLNDTSGNPQRLAIGFFQKPVKTFTLAVKVMGPVMTLTINGVTVDTITNTTYATTNALALVLEDVGATKPASALFSQFSFTPLATPVLSNADAVATATAVAQHQPAYKAAVPGPGCDKGKGQWDPIDLGDPTTKITCTSKGMQMVQPATAQYIGQARFFDLDGNFPANYSVAVSIDLSNINGGRAGIFARASAAGGYHVYIYPTGTWTILKDDANGNATKLGTGQVTLNAAQLVQLVVTARGTTISLSVNGAQATSISDTTSPLTATNDVSLVTDAGTADATAVFSDFVFTPLS
jgi:hypothetical protein